jgi:hypothetical protein
MTSTVFPYISRGNHEGHRSQIVVEVCSGGGARVPRLAHAIRPPPPSFPPPSVPSPPASQPSVPKPKLSSPCPLHPSLNLQPPAGFARLDHEGQALCDLPGAGPALGVCAPAVGDERRELLRAAHGVLCGDRGARARMHDRTRWSGGVAWRGVARGLGRVHGCKGGRRAVLPCISARSPARVPRPRRRPHQSAQAAPP